MTEESDQHIIANEADAEAAGALVQRILMSGRARIRTRVTIPDAALVQVTDTLIDVPEGRAFSLTTTAIGDDERGPKPSFYAGGTMRLPMETAEGVLWAEVGNVTLADLGYGILLWVSGITVGEDGVIVLDPARAIAATPVSLREALEKTLTDVGWQNRGYSPPARASLQGDRTGVDFAVDLGGERGPEAVRTRYESSLCPDPEAAFPPWPEADERYDHDSFVRAIVPDWPDDVSLSRWWRGE